MNDNHAQINPVCHQMLNCRLTGNITPISWFRNILTGSGKPDVVSIILLSDIVYWYTPVMTRDEHTGDVIGIQQKFQADKLQKTYQEYADIFSFSKNQIKNAIDNLVSQNLITREFRHIKTGSGLAITNVMYIEPNIENIIKISNKSRSPQKVGGYPPKKLGDIPPKSSGISHQKNGGPPPKKFGVIPPKNGGTYTETTTEITTETTTTTEAAAVDLRNRFPKSIRSRIPRIYQDHRDVLDSIDAYFKTHGKSYVAAELDYATHNSTKNGGFPAFLKRSLESGWGTEDLKVRQAAQNERRILESRQKERDLEALRAEQELLADIEKWDRQIDQKVQETLECISPTELNRIKTEAWEQAEKKTPSLRGQTSQVLTAAKEKLSTLSDPERKTLFEVAKAAVRASIGNLLGENHPGFHRAVDSQVLKEIQERYPLHTPLADLWNKRVKAEADRILKVMVIRNYGLLKSQTVRNSP
ncbi:hypothetical protein [Desulfosarcina ovata]|nr:hypothetical protein [Desulfosarcina ovata]